MFVMLDGIDGSGKGTVIDAWKKYLTDQGNAIFDLRHYLKENDRYPELHEAKAYDFIFSAEPTYTGIGKVIREELINADNNYPARAIADAYSLDREVLYSKMLIPLLGNGRCVIQDRGVSTSLAYQTANNELDFETITSLIGNKLALEHRPDHLILLKVDPEIAFQRLQSRLDKQDNSIFEKQIFLKKLATQFDSTEFENIFKKRGTQIHYLSGSEKIDIMCEQAVNLLKEILK